MSRRDDDEARLVRCLLHDLPEEERAEVELAFLADDGRFEELEALEDELRHDYLAGTLPPKWRRPFEERFLATPDGRRRLESARRTLAALDRGARRPKRSRERWWLAAAAAVAIAASSWALYERQSGRARLGALRATTSGAAERERADALERQLRLERERREALERELAAREEPPVGPRAVAVLALGPGLVRGGGGRTAALSAEHGALRLTLRLPDGSAPIRVQAAVRDAEGAEVWFRDRLAPRGAPGEAHVALAVPARVLPAGDYEVLLSAETAPGRSEEIADYYFAVVRR